MGLLLLVSFPGDRKKNWHQILWGWTGDHNIHVTGEVRLELPAGCENPTKTKTSTTGGSRSPPVVGAHVPPLKFRGEINPWWNLFIFGHALGGVYNTIYNDRFGAHLAPTSPNFKDLFQLQPNLTELPDNRNLWWPWKGANFTKEPNRKREICFVF